MKNVFVLFLFLFGSIPLFSAPIPDIVYLSKGYQIQIGIIKGLDVNSHEVLFKNSDFNPNYGSKMAVHPETGGFVVFLTGAPLAQPKGKKSYYCSWGNIQNGIEGYVELQKGFGDFFSKPFFSLDGGTIYYYGLFKFETVLNSIDPATKKQSKFFYNKWPAKFKPKKSQFGNLTLSEDQESVAFAVGAENDSSIYTFGLKDKEPKKILTVKNLLDHNLSWHGDYIFYCDFILKKDNYKKVFLNAVDIQTMKSKQVFKYTEGGSTRGEFPPDTMIYDPEGNMIFFMDTHNDAFLNVADIYMMSLDTFESEKIIENASGLYAVSKDGNLLLYTTHQSPVDTSDPMGCGPSQENPVCIAVYDIKKGKSKKLAVSGPIDFEYMNFVY